MKPPIPVGLTSDQFATRFRRQLEQHSSVLYSELRSLFATSIGKGTTGGSVELFLDPTGEAGPRIGVYFLGDKESPNPPEGTIGPGSRCPLGTCLKSLQRFDGQYFTDEEFGATNIQADVLKAWLAEWWWKAGGWAYPLRVDLTVHDDFGNGERVLLSPGVQT